MQENVHFRDLAVPGVSVSYGRGLEVGASGLPLARGVPLGVEYAARVVTLPGGGLQCVRRWAMAVAGAVAAMAAGIVWCGRLR